MPHPHFPERDAALLHLGPLARHPSMPGARNLPSVRPVGDPVSDCANGHYALGSSACKGRFPYARDTTGWNHCSVSS